ncbi:MAG: hypothetical protein NTX47_03025 [Candidatus Omnitrophica bacterium]|nr:hypothetical protein [Candidatus Omnitrophota bacterium]
MKPYLMHAYNFYSTLKDIIEDRISFRVFFNRTSSDDSTFSVLADLLKKKDIVFINHPDRVKKSKEALRSKEQYGNDSFLIQEKILPINLGNRPAWFRVIYCFGKIIPCWWHPVTHVYDVLTVKQICTLGLDDIWYTTKRISQICELDFFSTEVILKNNKRFIVVDYVNDQIDMRKKSKFDKGFPDEVVEKIVEDIVLFVKQRTRRKPKRWPIELE